MEKLRRLKRSRIDELVAHPAAIELAKQFFDPELGEYPDESKIDAIVEAFDSVEPDVALGAWCVIADTVGASSYFSEGEELFDSLKRLHHLIAPRLIKVIHAVTEKYCNDACDHESVFEAVFEADKYGSRADLLDDPEDY